MARRLLSGWLIALAALARSLALMFERAAADRSEPAPEPVMAELVTRYPGAPAHWLTHVAEGMARTAKAGEVPLSLTSDPMAWPPWRPTVTTASQEESAAAPDAADRPALDPPRRSSPPPARRAVEAVPSLAALQSRASEVWRRPAVTARRPSRPVFAPPVDPVPARAVSENVAPPTTSHQPRPRPIVAVRVPSQARSYPSAPWVSAVETVRGEATPPAVAQPADEIRPSPRPEPQASPAGDGAPSKARAAPLIRSVAKMPPIVTAFEPPVGKAPRSMPHPEAERPAAIDAAPAKRPALSLARHVRRAIFQTLAALRDKPRADRQHASPRPHLASEAPIFDDARQPVQPLPFVFPSGAEPRVASRRPAPQTGLQAARRTPRLVWSQAPAQVQAPRQTPPPSVDNRWPAFPPKTFSPPPVAEAPAPRLEQLAREQEEGRWSV
uniref:Uncharacterized protein n=1 Tax=Caulobacter sp. (strain K31) TaxID=366602 RepID=B0T1D5_CAUSK